MAAPKKLRYFPLMAALLLAPCITFAQQTTTDDFAHKIRLTDSLSFYQINKQDTLYRFLTADSMFNRVFKTIYYGWIKNQDKNYIHVLNVDGGLYLLKRSELTHMEALPANNTTADSIVSKYSDVFSGIKKFGQPYLVGSWLFKNGMQEQAKRVFFNNGSRFTDASDTGLRDNFGIITYDAMLYAFSKDRDYATAIAYGEHLSKSIFNGYPYQKTAIALTQQLKNNPGDFKIFRLPDSLEWVALKQKLSRTEQIDYLAKRLRLLNCIQPGQPGGIDYDMYQYAVSFAESYKIGFEYWRHNPRYEVINPFVEIIRMKLTTPEVKLLLPYLLSDDYIASYSYFRDFRPDRALHKVSWVAHELIFEITCKEFITPNNFEKLSKVDKQAEVAKIGKWCDDNANLSADELTIKELKTADNWTDFSKALATAQQQKLRQLLPIIVHRFKDFDHDQWALGSEAMAETMYRMGDASYIDTVKQWSRDTTSKTVNLWAALFLLKNDKNSYQYAMDELERILKEDDGTYYYPHAMDQLLGMNDPRAFKLAEGIMAKERFADFVSWGYYLDFVKRLLLAKSDYTFHYLNSKIAAFSPDETEQLTQTKNEGIAVRSDNFVIAVDNLRTDSSTYYQSVDIKDKIAYRKTLSVWFTTQYQLLKAGKPNELKLKLSNANAPVSFVDSPN